MTTAPQPPHSLLRRIVIGRNPKFTLIRAAVLAATCFITFKFILLPVRVTGGSMEPTYHDHRVNFINCLAYLRHEPRRGDVIGYEFTGHSIMLLKRIVGLPGERVGFNGGYVVINGERQPEPYLKLTSNWEREAVQLGPDEYFIVGDNRSMRIKDHTFGVAKRARIIGKILL